MKRTLLSIGATALLATSTCTMAKVAELTFAFSDDDPQFVQFIKEKSKEFSDKHDNINISVVSAGWSYTNTQLPIQLSVGEGPDLVKATGNFGEFALDMRPYMSDEESFRKLYGNNLQKLIDPEHNKGDEIFGFVASQTVNLPFVNKTLFEQAGVPIPEKGYTLAELVEASGKVAKLTDTEIPFTIDRSGHRLVGPILSDGGRFIRNGEIVFPDQATRNLFKDLKSWVDQGYFPEDMWGSAGGHQYKGMDHEFINGNAVTYFAGNWMVNPFSAKVGNFFEWELLPTPQGTESSATYTGGNFVYALKHTKHPKEVVQFIEFLGSEPVQREIAERFLLLPGIQVDDIQFQTDDENVKRSLNNALSSLNENPAIVDEVKTDLQNWYLITEAQGVMAREFTRAIVGELTLDQSLKQMKKAVAVYMKDLCRNQPDLNFCSPKG